MSVGPRLTVDAVVFNDRGDILLVRRAGMPFAGCYALPGGKVEEGETVEQACVRELREETGLRHSRDLTLIGVYSHPNRDPRGHHASVAFLVGEAKGELLAGSDAASAEFVRNWRDEELAFDHRRIIEDAAAIRRLLAEDPIQASKWRRLTSGEDKNSAAIALIERLLEAQPSENNDVRFLIEAILTHARRHPAREVLTLRSLRGEVLIREGESPKSVDILIDGRLEVLTKTGSDSELRRLTLLSPPTIVGEIGILTGTTTATVRAEPGTLVQLITLDTREFESISKEDPVTWEHYRDLVSNRLAAHVLEGAGVSPQIAHALLSVLQSIDGNSHDSAIFKRMTEDSILSHPDIFHWRRVEPRETIILEGERLDFVGVIIRGQAEVAKERDFKIEIGPGSLLGEMSALTGKAATATVRAGDEPVDLLCLSQTEFQQTILIDAEARAAARELCLERLSEQFEGETLGKEVEDLLRDIRDQNTDALVRRSGIRLISGDGLFAVVNPERVGYEEDGAHIELIDQKYRLLASAEILLRNGWSEEDIVNSGRRIRSQVDKQELESEASAVREAITSFSAYTAHIDLLSYKSISKTNAGTLEQYFFGLQNRCKRVRWLNERLLRDGKIEVDRLETRGLEEHVEDVFAAANPDAILDEEFRRVMELGVREASESFFKELQTIMFHKVPFEVESFDKQPGTVLPDGYGADNRRALIELRERLDRGEVSAIGGISYPQQRFSIAVLDSVAAGKISVLIFDGEPAEATAWGRSVYGRDPATGTFWPCLTTEIQGLDGSGPRTLLTVKKSGGEILQVLIIAGYGTARQLHNAGAILLYENDDGDRIPPVNLSLAGQGIDYIDLMRREIIEALEEFRSEVEGTEVLGEPLENVADLPTQLLILQNPQEFEEALGADRIVLRIFQTTVLSFWVGVARIAGRLVRLVSPKVGGHGLYGDTAGHFVSAFFTAGIERALPHVIFNGTAGGFGSTEGTPSFEEIRGLGDIRPGGIITPTETIEQIDDGVGPRSIRTLFHREGKTPDEALQEILAEAGIKDPIVVNFVSRHGAVAAPAVETFQYISDKLVGRGIGSVDVEGGAIWRAVMELGREELTFTPVYTHSDDPRSSKENPSDSLAAMGPWFEGVELDRQKYLLLEALVQVSLTS